MRKNKCIELLGGWEGYQVGTVEYFAAGTKGPRPQVWIELLPVRGRVKRCNGCGQPVDEVHDVAERWVRDLAVFEAETWLLVHRCRVRCPVCGPKLERLSWLAKYARVTQRLADSVGRLCAVLSIKHVADHFGLGWDAVKAIDKGYLGKRLGPVDLSDVEVIALDEFSIRKRHRYATVIVDPRTKRVLWVGRGRCREDIRPFFEMLGPVGRGRVRAAVIDMSNAYEQEVRAQCPQAQIVYDLFHIVAKYSREVVDRVRVDEANRLRHDPSARKVIKGSRWLLLRNGETIKSERDRVRLRELLAANRKLATVYILKDDLKALWAYRHPGYAWRFWQEWYQRAIHSQIEPLKTFARRLREKIDGVMAHCRWPLHTSLLEGINNKIKVIKRVAYGFRDDDYFFLKIRAAFPGIPG